MDKKSQMGSSVYISEKAVSINSQKQYKHKQRQTSYKVEIVNQNLEDAIKQIKCSVKENPEWHLNVQAVSKSYKKKKQIMPIINQTQNQKVGNDVLPQSNKQPQPLSLEPCKKINFQGLRFTERKKKQYLERLKQIKQKRMQLEVLSLEKQMRAKLDRKVRQNQSLKEKAKIIKDIQQRRQDKMRLSGHQNQRKKKQKQMLHESNLAKVDMLRRSKKKSKKRQLSESYSRSQESKIQLKFKEYLVDKQKQQRKQLLVNRFRMIKSASQGQFRTRSQARTMQTSESTRRFKNSDVVYL